MAAEGSPPVRQRTGDLVVESFPDYYEVEDGSSRSPFDPRPGGEGSGFGANRYPEVKDDVNGGQLDYEELYEKVPHAITTLETALLATRCAVVFVCLVCVLVVMGAIVARRANRIKSWRLYLLTALTVLSWVAMTLYQDHIDEYFVQEVNRYPQSRSIFWCFRNLAHGLSLFLVVLLLGHLSDFQHQGSWFLLVATVVLVPLAYSVALLVIDLRLVPDVRLSWEFNIGVATFRVFLYNFITTILIFAYSNKMCTRRLYGTYSEHKNPLVVLISRWIFVFLLLHNLTTMASYGASVASRVPYFEDARTAAFVHRILDEVLLGIIVLAVPVSYLIALAAKCCCGVDNDTDNVEMDKIYQEVWRPPASGGLQQPTQVQKQPPTPEPIVPRPQAAPSTDPNGPAFRGSGGGRTKRDSSGSSTTTSQDTVGDMPNFQTRPQQRPKSRSKNRESYLEAVSIGSLEGSNSSITSEPIDL